MAPRERHPSDVEVVADELESRLTADPWTPAPSVAPETEVASFALTLSGKRTQARRGGRVGRLIASFALAACLALASVAAACDKPDASGAEAAEAINQLQSAGPAEAAISAKPRAAPGQFADLVLVSAGTTAQPWAVLLPKDGGTAPILVDSVGSEMDTVGGVYRVPAQPVTVGTRDGASQFLDPLIPAEQTGTSDISQRSAAVQGWAEDERYLAVTRAIAGTPSVLDAAYNADAAATAGGTHTYLNGVVLRAEPDKPVLQVIDKALLESGRPTRAEDIVYVAIRPAEQALYEPGAVVNLRDVVMDKQQSDVNGEPLTVYVANAALEGSRVEPTGSVDLQALLGPRLQRVNEDLALQAQDAQASGQPAAATPTGTQTPAVVQQTIINNNNNRGSHIGDFLIYAWLFNNSFYRGPGVVINNPGTRPGGDLYYSPPPNTSSGSPTTTAAQQSAARNNTVQASRAAVSGTSGGTGGGVAATNKAAADSTARVSAATSKATAVASTVSSSSSGKSITSVPKSSSTTSSRSAGTVSSGSRGTSVSSSSSSSSGGFGGKGVGSSGSS